MQYATTFSQAAVVPGIGWRCRVSSREIGSGRTLLDMASLVWAAYYQKRSQHHDLGLGFEMAASCRYWRLPRGEITADSGPIIRNTANTSCLYVGSILLLLRKLFKATGSLEIKIQFCRPKSSSWPLTIEQWN